MIDEAYSREAWFNNHLCPIFQTAHAGQTIPNKSFSKYS